MTTDDGLKGLTDEQWKDLHKTLTANFDNNFFNGLDIESSWADLANAARAWLAANVHDSVDGVDAARYRFIRDKQATIIYKRNGAASTWEPLLDTRETSTRCGSLDDAVDKAILAEKGEV